MSDRSIGVLLAVLGGAWIGVDRVVTVPLHDLDGVGVVYLAIGLLVVVMGQWECLRERSGRRETDPPTRLTGRRAGAMAACALGFLIAVNVAQRHFLDVHLLSFGSRLPLLQDVPTLGVVFGTFSTGQLPAFFVAWLFVLSVARATAARMATVLVIAVIPVVLALDQELGPNGFGWAAGLAIAGATFLVSVLYAVPLLVAGYVLGTDPERRAALFARFRPTG